MLVYRLEDNLGQGVYSKGAIGFLANAAAMARDAGRPVTVDHPAPKDDEGLKDWWEGPLKNWSKKKAAWHDGSEGRRSYSCGFSSMDQLLDWFPKAGIQMIVDDAADWVPGGKLKLVTYEVHAQKVKRGRYQAMFRKTDARMVEEIGLEELVKTI